MTSRAVFDVNFHHFPQHEWSVISFFADHSCLIPADGFYEWRKTAKPKLPFAIAMKDGRPFTFAGLWENWKDPESGEWLRTCTIITGEPNELIAQIHPRMPVISSRATSRSLARGN